MKESGRLEEHGNIEKNIIKDVRNLFRLKKLENEINYASIKGIENDFRLKN